MSKDNYGFLRVAGCVPRLKLAQPEENAKRIISMLREGEEKKVGLAVFPPLALTGSTCGDLFFQRHLYERQMAALEAVVSATEGMEITAVMGFFLSCRGRLYHCAAVIQNGRVKKVLSLPTAKELLRWFPVQENMAPNAVIGGEEFEAVEDYFSDGQLKIGFSKGCHILICMDAKDQLVGSADFHRAQGISLSGEGHCGYIYISPGIGESTASGVFGGHCILAENGFILAESDLFPREDTMILTEIDTEKILHLSTEQSMPFPDGIFDYCSPDVDPLAYVAGGRLLRSYSKTPFIPEDYSKVCQEVFAIQAWGLARRIEAAYAKKVVIGISGGLDSTLAVLVCHRALKLLGRSPKDAITITMPGFGTTNRTYENALTLMEQLGTDLREISIAQSVRLHFKDIGHDEENRDVTYENAQARERTQILMDVANMEGGLVVGTGDLSEAALGWCTYNGDHMSMYSVNSDVPKTLVKVLVQWYAENLTDPAMAQTLCSIADTPISPELLPPDEAGNIAQKTEDKVGPYQLHDFFLYHTIRSGWTPKKLLYVAEQTFADIYDRDFIRSWQNTFYRRFFTQQFKRNCAPDGPRVGSLSLSPHGDWIMPSDAGADIWTD